MAQFPPSAAGTYFYGYRYSTDGGASWTNAGVGGPNGAPGVAHVSPPADTTAPAAPAGLTVASSGPTEIDLIWTANSEPDIFGCEIDRSSGGAFTTVGTSTGASFADTSVVSGTTYTYVVKAVDTSTTPSPPAPPAPAA